MDPFVVKAMLLLVAVMSLMYGSTQLFFKAIVIHFPVSPLSVLCAASLFLFFLLWPIPFGTWLVKKIR